MRLWKFQLPDANEWMRVVGIDAETISGNEQK